MTVERWLENAAADAERRGLRELKPLLEALAQATRVLRSADLAESADGSKRFNENAQGAPRDDRSVS